MKNNNKSETVKVAVRVRPMNSREKEKNSTICVSIDNQNNSISVTSDKNDSKSFQFDYVFGIESTQREVYDSVAFPIVEGIFQGYNGTVFAYGQTGCGKTFTMMGDIKDDNLKGVIPNSFSHIFGYIEAEGKNKKFLVRCSFVEIYNEEVRDLLGVSNKEMKVREDPKKGTYVQDLSYHFLSNSQEIIACLDRGNNNRHVGATSMNAKSSRSHSLFTVYLEIQEGEGNDKKIRTGKLNLVDLAGSERVGKTNATGQTFEEGKKINLSLTALGSVIDALSSNRKHIPYKDSKLTRLLSDSLGGNSRTVMFANVSPASYNYEETVGTLRYASRAKLIKNAPKINEDPKDALLRKYEEEIKLLREQLQGNINPNISETNPKEVVKEVIVTKDMDSEERKELLAKIAMLEKGVISGGEESNIKDNKKRQKEIQIEKKKFHEYRLAQLKKMEEMDQRYEKLIQEKIKEEENLNNDITKLKKLLKYYKNEIDDLKLENEKDRIDFLENIKDTAKDAALYKGIVDFLLSNFEIRKIIDLSKYDEVNQKWFIHPFYFKDKIISFPNINKNKVNEYIDNILDKRDMIIGNKDNDNFNKNNVNYNINNNSNQLYKKKYFSDSSDNPFKKSIYLNKRLMKEQTVMI